MQKNKAIFIFLSVLAAVNMLQCCFTELLHDEAYYWLWSKYPACGYFDHPPMIALFNGLGDAILHHEIGVRLFSILANAFTIYVLFRIVNPKNEKLFFAVLISITPVLAAGFFAVPDTPLLLFTACFYFVYKKFIEEESHANTFLLGLCMALVLYSKYHGLLVFIFILLADLSLLKRKTFYLASLLGAVLFLPHLWWQWQNDFPTFRFHFFERAKDVYTILLSTDYVGGQILFAGLPCGMIFLYALWKQKTENKFQRALKFQFWGVNIFFLLSTFKGKTEANWASVNLIPLIILGYTFLENNLNLSRWVYRLLPLSILSILIVRIHFATDWSKKYFGVNCETQHWEDWAQTVSKEAGDLPLVFFSSYQKASKYTFYTGKKSFSFPEVGMRKSQFNLWDMEEELQNKKVYCYNYWFRPTHSIDCRKIKTDADEYDGCVTDSFLSWVKISVKPEKNFYEIKRGENISVPVQVTSPYLSHPSPNQFSRITYQVYGSDKKKRSDNETGILLNDALSQKNLPVKILLPDTADDYYVFISVSQDNFPASINSPKISFSISAR